MTWAVWITGLPSSGKTAIARKVRTLLKDQGVANVKVLELDEIRRFITPQPTYSDEEREIVYASLVYMAKLLVDCGTPVIIDATANRRRYRDRARAAISKFAEVHVKCSLETCMARERRRRARYAPAGIYKRSQEEGATVPGVNVPYEEPVKSEVEVDSETMTIKKCAERVVEFVLNEYET